MEIVLGTAMVALVGVVAASFIHRLRQRMNLKRHLLVDESLKKRTAEAIGLDGAVVAGVSLFDVFYNTMKLDPHALRGIAHLHHAENFEKLSDVIGFMKTEIIKSSDGQPVWRQMVHKYKGYTGEEVAFDNLAGSGPAIEVPTSGTAPGLDVVVDGKPYNVKVTDNPAYVQERLNKHPDIDVITNREMAEGFQDNPRVIIDPDLSSKEAFHATSETFEGIADLGDLIDNIPLITLAMKMAKNGRKVYRGDIGLVTAAEYVVVETVTLGAGGAIGGKVGLAIGLALAPVTGGLSAVAIPAAATLIGTLAGVFAGKGVGGWVKERHLRAAVQRLQTAAADFRNRFLELYSTVVGAADSYFSERIVVAAEASAGEGLLKRILFPSFATTFYRMAVERLDTERRQSQGFYVNLHRALSSAEPSEGGMILFAQGVGAVSGVPPLPEHYGRIKQQLDIIEAEKRKLK